VSRVVHYRLHGASSEQLEQVEQQFGALAAAREWRGDSPWVATPRSPELFAMEYLRHVREEEGDGVTAAGFLRLAGDETDALVLVVFLRDLSEEHGIRVSVRDEDHPLSKLRYLEFHGGRLPSGNSLEQLLSRRGGNKKVDGRAITFYAPSHPLNAGRGDEGVRWGYQVGGMRAFAPTLLEAEREALKILRALRRLGS
jgi:hypothetical protein